MTAKKPLVPLMSVAEPQPVPPGGRVARRMQHPFWALAFRPLYLFAALFAVVSVPLWIARFFGYLPGLPNVGLAWHMHEMVFGFAIAVVVGFLFTAGKAWTGLQTPHGGQLAGFVLLWLAGRLAMVCAPAPLAAVVDLLFLPLAAVAFFLVLKKAGNTRNMPIVGLLVLLTLVNALFHASVLGWLPLAPVTPIEAAIFVVVVIESVIGARVIPMFTRNGAPGVEPAVRPRLDKAAMALMVLAALAWIFRLPPPLTATLALAASIAMLVRLAGWQPRRTLRVPLLWILHVSYGWIGIGFFLLALAALGLVSASAAFHALAVGSMAGLILGMMTRTTLGHTGRLLKAGRVEFCLYLLIQLGALARVAAALGGAQLVLLTVAAVCWSAAFLLFAIKYAPYLYRPRIDGREG